MKNLSQKGFTLIESLLIVIALTLVVGVGFYVVNANKDKKEAAKTSEVPNEPSVQKSEQSKVEYVEFRDLGFKIIKTENMADWSYLDDAQVSKTKYVQSAAHVKKIDECNKGSQDPILTSIPSDKSFAAFSRVEGTYKSSDEPGSILVKQFDTFYISIGYPNGGSPCSNEKGVGYPVERAPAGAQEALLVALKNAQKL